MEKCFNYKKKREKRLFILLEWKKKKKRKVDATCLLLYFYLHLFVDAMIFFCFVFETLFVFLLVSFFWIRFFWREGWGLEILCLMHIFDFIICMHAHSIITLLKLYYRRLFILWHFFFFLLRFKFAFFFFLFEVYD